MQVPVRVTSRGFVIGGGVIEELRGRVVLMRLKRKRFEDGKLLCHSLDGHWSRSGIYCADCLHPQCRPFLCINLRCWSVIYYLELGWTSARNLLEVEDRARGEGRELSEWTLRLTVFDRGEWGEVRFEVKP